MKRITNRNAVVWLSLILAICALPSRADGGPSLEYQIKASYLYNFLLFVNLPEAADFNDGVLTLGVLGTDQFGTAIDKIAGKTVHGKIVDVRRFQSIAEMEPCQVLFIAASERDNVNEIRQWLGDRRVLTISEFEDSGMPETVINFIHADNKISFEINRTLARKSGLRISSELLRVAAVVYE